LRNGGLQTLASFGIGNVSEAANSDWLESAHEEFRAALTDGLEDWLRAQPLTWSSGNLWAVHAAAKPLVPMPEQEPYTLLWGYGEFMTSFRPDGIWVAHGHVVVEQPEMRASRIAMGYRGLLLWPPDRCGDPARRGCLICPGRCLRRS
jgi:serine/threonine protein phosphatase 1